MRFLAIALAALALVSCSRDPNVLKQKYLQSGNKYYEKGKYKEDTFMESISSSQSAAVLRLRAE